MPENQWVFVVADLSEVWVDFAVPVRDRSEIDVGDKVRVSSPGEDYTTEATISYISPFVDERTQSQLFRGVIANKEKRFFPGTYIAGDVTTDAVVVPIAVKREAVQRLGNWDVVFIKIGDTYEARPVVLGRADSSYVEIVDGINSGDEFVAGNSFIVKADILKAGASHDH